MTLLEDYSSDEDLFKPHAREAWQRSADHEQRAMADRAKRRGGKSFVDSNGQAMFGGLLFVGIVAVASLAHKHFIKGEPVFLRRRRKPAADTLSDEEESTDEDEEVATHYQEPTANGNEPLHPRAEKLWGQASREESPPTPGKPKLPAVPTTLSSPSKPSLPAVPAALDSPAKGASEAVTAFSPDHDTADGKLTGSEASASGDPTTSGSSAAADGKSEEAGGEPAPTAHTAIAGDAPGAGNEAVTPARTAAKGASTGQAALPEKVNADSDQIDTGGKAAGEAASAEQAAHPKEVDAGKSRPPGQDPLDAVIPAGLSSDSNDSRAVKALEDKESQNADLVSPVEELAEKHSDADNIDQKAGPQTQKAGGGPSAGGKEEAKSKGKPAITAPEKEGANEEAKPAIASSGKEEASREGQAGSSAGQEKAGGTPAAAVSETGEKSTAAGASIPGFKLAEGADPAIGGSRRSADMREQERRSESGPASRTKTAASRALDQVLEPATQTLAAAEDSPTAEVAAPAKSATPTGQPAGESNVGNLVQDSKELAAEKPATHKQGSEDSGRSSFEAAAQTPLSQPVNTSPSAKAAQPEAKVEEGQAQADPAAGGKAALDGNDVTEPVPAEENTPQSKTSMDGVQETDNAEDSESKGASLKSRSSSLKGHNSGGERQKLERKVSFADGSVPGKAADNKPPTGTAESALSHEIPEEQPQAASLTKEPSQAMNSASAAEPTTIAAEADKLNIEAGGPVRVSSVASAKSSPGKDKEGSSKASEELPTSPPKEAIPAAVAKQFGVPISPAVDTFFSDTDVLTDLAEEAAAGGNLTSPAGGAKPAEKSKAGSTKPKEATSKPKEKKSVAAAPKAAVAETAAKAEEKPAKLGAESKPVGTDEAGKGEEMPAKSGAESKPMGTDEAGKEEQKMAELGAESKPVETDRTTKEELAGSGADSTKSGGSGDAVLAAQDGKSDENGKDAGSGAPGIPKLEAKTAAAGGNKAGATVSESEASQSESDSNGMRSPRGVSGVKSPPKKKGGSGGGGSSKKKKKRNK